MQRFFARRNQASVFHKHRKVILAVAAMVVFALVAHFRARMEHRAGRGGEDAAVVKVVDGDTVILSDGRFVRYVGIDTPEMDAASERAREFARAATEINRRMVEGREVRLEYDVERKDKYGRTLAYVYVDGESVNARLVAGGHARAEFFGDNRRHLDEYKRLEAQARAERLGIWAGE